MWDLSDMRKSGCFWNYAAGFVSQEEHIWFSKPCWLSHAPAVCTNSCAVSTCNDQRWSWEFIQCCLWTAHTHPGCVSGTVLRATTTTRLLPPTSRKWAQFFPHSSLFESGRETMLLTTCRKLSYGHPPGIFTLFCSHGICYGFEVMQSCELPRHPFQIFRQRFHTAPCVIIYDNACKLHQYCLNREPNFFANTL